MLFSDAGFWALVALVLVAAYLIGAIPWALIIGKRFYGIDPRDHGSGNLGATNVFRLLGARAGVATLLLDATKGATAVFLARFLIPGATFGIAVSDWVAVGAMMAAVLGHSFSPYIRFKGGKGVATAAGGILVLMPLAFAILLVIFVTAVAIWRIVSLGSVVSAFAFPVLMLVLYSHRPAFMVFATVASTLVIWRHRSNIARIARGEEARVSLSRRGTALQHEQASGQTDEGGE